MKYFAAVFRAVSMCALLLIANGASAQVVLFDGPDLQGRKLTVRSDEPDLAGSDFNARAQSLVVQGGTWEFCADASFRGDCMRLQPGEYRALDKRFMRAISSLRPLAGGDGAVYSGQGPQSAPQAARPPPPPSITYVTPPAPSTCSIGKGQVCAACSVTCSGTQKAFCKNGYEYSKFGTMTCEFAPVCECRGR